MLAVIYSLFSAVAYGVSDFYGALASRKTSPLIASLVIHAAAGVAVGFSLIFVPGVWSTAGMVAGIGCGVIESVGFVLFYISMTMGPVSILAPIVAVIYAIVPVAWAVSRGETLSTLAWWGVLLGCISVIALSIGPKSGSASDEEIATAKRAGRSARPSLAAIGVGASAALLWGFSTVFLDYAPADSGITPAFIEMVAAVVTLIFVLLIMWRKIDSRIEPTTVSFIIVAGVLFGAANSLLLLALITGSLATVGMLVSLYPLATVLLARFVLREHVSKIQWTGIAGALVAVALIGSGI
jgi:uncharacterized membrane protein